MHLLLTCHSASKNKSMAAQNHVLLPKALCCVLLMFRMLADLPALYLILLLHLTEQAVSQVTCWCRLCSDQYPCVCPTWR